MNIVQITSECLPFSKTGGLGDVIFSLSKEFIKNKDNVAIITPFYKNGNTSFFKKISKVAHFKVVMNWREINCEVYHTLYKKIDYFLIKDDQYFNRDNYYGYFDDGERFAFFCNAAVELLKIMPFKVDICHVHDHQTGMIPCLLKVKYKDHLTLGHIKTVLTIHNPLFKGFLDSSALFDLYNLNADIYNNGKVRLEGKVSTLKAGIVYSDKITTVSPTHAQELLTKEGSKGLDYDLVLRKDDFYGFVNGIDYEFFNPKTDKCIYYNYGSENVDAGKKRNKVAFCKEHNLDAKKPLFGVCSRLTDQKGIDVLTAMADFVVNEGGCFVLLGSGERWAEDSFRKLKNDYPENVFIQLGYDESLAHKIYASCDFFIMPSKFEPCGIGQLVAQRYGTLPLVRLTGGLKDTVNCYNGKNAKTANGFGFYNYSVIEGVKCVALTLITYAKKGKTMTTLRKNAMKTDNRWAKTAHSYLDLFSKLLRV
ncbi:MAG: glycogen synthase [Candidatus Onthovivens sp.]|nr:glycogen synthase [Candidatus Onthovivens sp.]